MKRLAIILCLPSMLIAGDQSPVHWEQLKKQYHVVQELEKRLAELEEAHRNLQRKISGQTVFLEEAAKLQENIADIDPQNSLYEIVSAPLDELKEKQQQDTQQCQLTAQVIQKTAQALEREVWYATGLEMRDQKEKLAGVAQRVQEREQRNQHNEDNKRDGIPTALANAKRGGSESTQLAQAVHSSTDTADKAIQELFNNVRILEEEVWNFSQQLTQETDTTEPAPKDEALALLLNLKDNITILKADLGKMVLAAHPDAQERQTYLATLTSEPSPSATLDTLSDAQKIKRSLGSTHISIIIPIITIHR